MQRLPAVLVSVLALIAMATSCDVSFLAPVRNSYALQTVAGDSLPAKFALDPAFPGRIVADTIILRQDGTGEEYTVVADIPGVSARTDKITFTYLLSKNRISISYDCPSFSECVEAPHLIGTIGSAGIIFDISKISRVPLVFDIVTRS